MWFSICLFISVSLTWYCEDEECHTILNQVSHSHAQLNLVEQDINKLNQTLKKYIDNHFTELYKVLNSITQISN